MGFPGCAYTYCMFNSALFGDVMYYYPALDGSVNEDVVITKPFGNDKMTCREIRRNSAGCVRLREECEKCKEIQHIGEFRDKGTLHIGN